MFTLVLFLCSTRARCKAPVAIKAFKDNLFFDGIASFRWIIVTPLSMAEEASKISLSIASEIELLSAYSRSKVLTLKILFFKIQSSFL